MSPRWGLEFIGTNFYKDSAPMELQWVAKVVHCKLLIEHCSFSICFSLRGNGGGGRGWAGVGRCSLGAG
jgi:hypothetical protein